MNTYAHRLFFFLAIAKFHEHSLFLSHPFSVFFAAFLKAVMDPGPALVPTAIQSTSCRLHLPSRKFYRVFSPSSLDGNIYSIKCLGGAASWSHSESTEDSGAARTLPTGEINHGRASQLSHGRASLLSHGRASLLSNGRASLLSRPT